MDETSNNNQLGDLLSGLMSNPDAVNMISGLMKSMSAPQTSAEPVMESVEGEASVSESEPQVTQSESQTTGAFGGINPDMLKMLPNIMSMLGPMINQNKSETPASAPKDDTVQTSGVPSGGHPHHNHKTAEQRNKLLYALKPYLSHSRREAVEQIAKITQITDMLGETGILTSLRGDTHEGKNSEPDKNLGMIHKT